MAVSKCIKWLTTPYRRNSLEQRIIAKYESMTNLMKHTIEELEKNERVSRSSVLMAKMSLLQMEHLIARTKRAGLSGLTYQERRNKS